MKAQNTLFSLLLACTTAMFAAEPINPAEAEHYKITTFPTPPNTALEVSAAELLPDGRLVLGTRRGEIWMVSNAQHASVNGVWNKETLKFESAEVVEAAKQIKYERFAEGQHEVMGLVWKDGWLYVTNRYELLRM
jgi:glucose/arabinose dehydrogenase